MRRRRVTALLAALALAASPVPADVLFLQDGRIFEVGKTESTEAGVVLRYEHGDVVVPHADVLEVVLDVEPEFVPQTDEEREMVEKGFVRFGDKWMSRNRRDLTVKRTLEERAEWLASEEEMREWRGRHMEETKHFAFESTLPQPLFEHYRDLLEAYFEAFAKEWKVKPPRKAKRLRVCFYSDREKYLQITGIGSNVTAFFRFVEPMELHVYHDRLDPETTEKVLFHEANHYLQKLVDVGFRYPHWPGESLAEYYGASTFDPETGEVVSGLILEGRLTEVKQDLSEGKRIELLDLLTNDKYEDYNWGWTLVRFLMDHDQHGKNFRKFFLELPSSRKVDRKKGSHNLDTVEGDAMVDAFCRFLRLKDDQDVRELERDWYDYIDTLEVTSAKGKQIAAKRAAERGRKLKAKRLYKEAIAEGSTSALAHFELAQLHLERDEVEEALPLLARAVELDPLTTEFYLEYGRTLLEHGDDAQKAEGGRMLELAHDIEPENFWLLRHKRRWLSRHLGQATK